MVRNLIGAMLVASLVGCVGSIADGMDPEDPPTGGDPARPRPGGSSGAGGQAGAGMMPSAPARPGSCDTQIPGFIGLHRLNNLEYKNVVRDITGVDPHTVVEFPEDPHAAFFSNIAESLGTDQSLTQLYFDAAIGALDRAFLASRAAIVSCDPDALGAARCAEKVVREVGLKAFRRPLRPEEVTQFMALYESSRAAFPSGAMVSVFDESLKAALHAILISPQFIYRVIEMPSSSPSFVKALDPYELASRLSFLLWGRHPDKALFELAASGALANRETLVQQVERILEDPMATHLVDTFAQQWLKLEDLPRARPDPTAYPAFTTSLRQAMLAETSMLLADVFKADGSPFLLINADYTYANKQLATHYGLGNGPTGTTLAKVALAGTERAGLISHASLLTLNARPTESSIVQRGLWVLDRILCIPIASPPEDVPQLPADEGSISNPRKTLEAHTSDPKCAGCHAIIDPPGFGLENYDGIGRWRTKYRNGDPVDASGSFPGAGSFRGARELGQILSRDPRFPTCFAGHFMTFGLGRRLSDGDRCSANAIAESSVKPGGKFSDIVKGLVLSRQFMNQSGGN